MAGSVIAEVIGAVRFWVVLLLMAPVAYILSNQVYEAGDGWIKILGMEGFSKKIVAVLGLAIGLPLVTIFGSQIQSFLYPRLPTGMWLLPFIGVGILGILWLVNDAANMNLRDGQRSTQVLITGSTVLIIIPFLIQYITSTYDLGHLWRVLIVQPIMQSIITPIINNSLLIVTGVAACLYGYHRYTTD